MKYNVSSTNIMMHITIRQHSNACSYICSCCYQSNMFNTTSEWNLRFLQVLIPGKKVCLTIFFSKSVQNIGQSKSLQLAFMIKISLLFISTKHVKVHIRLFKKILSSEVVIGGLHVMYCKWKV